MFGLMFATGYIRPRDLLQMYHQGKANEARQQHFETACQDLAQYLQTASGAAVELPQILENWWSAAASRQRNIGVNTVAR